MQRHYLIKSINYIEEVGLPFLIMNEYKKGSIVNDQTKLIKEKRINCQDPKGKLYTNLPVFCFLT